MLPIGAGAHILWQSESCMHITEHIPPPSSPPPDDDEPPVEEFPDEEPPLLDTVPSLLPPS
jgi:hypothetical protein